jgi:TPR repeat protein
VIASLWFSALSAQTLDVPRLMEQAQGGNAEAADALGTAYANGEGVIQDLPAAMRYFRQAAAQGYARAQFNLGMMYELGRGVPPNPPEAFKNYYAAAQLGYGPAQFNVGNMYATGDGTHVDLGEAAKWFRQAADRGVVQAQYNLALAYEQGRGVGKDEPAAQKWYRLAAAQGYSRARYNLGLMLEDGRGSAPDLAGAAELYHLAALQGLGLAQNNYGILLAEGKGGLPADPAGAYAWLALAVENGVKSDGRDQLGRRLTVAQLAEGHRQLVRLRARIGTGGTISVPASPTALGREAAGIAPGSATVSPSELSARLVAAEEELARVKAAAEQGRSHLAEQLAAAQARIYELEQRNKELDDESRSAIIQLSAVQQQLDQAKAELKAAPDPAPHN